MQKINFSVNYLSGSKIYKKDDKGNKSKDLAYYRVDVIEIAKNKNGNMYAIPSTLFVNAGLIMETEFDKLELLDLIDIELEIPSMSNMENKRVSAFNVHEEDSDVVSYSFSIID